MAPVLFLAGTHDTVIPTYSVKRHYQSFCEGRGKRCDDTVYFHEIRGANHDAEAKIYLSGDAIVEFLNTGEASFASSAGQGAASTPVK